MHWRHITWAFALWNLVWAALVGLWLLNPAPSSHSNGPGVEPTPTKPPDWAMFEYWFLGFAALATVWLVTKWWTGRRHES